MAINFLPSNNFAGSSRYNSVFLPSLNYRGSAASGALRGGGANTSSEGIDYGVYDTGTGKVISLKTGKLFTGIEPRTGEQYLAGVKVAKPETGITDPNDPNRYKPLEIVKSPAIAGATTELLDTFKKTADASLQDFNAGMKSATAARDLAFKNSQAAANIEPFASTMRGLGSRYNTALDTASSQYADLNAENEAAMRALEAEGKAILPKYDAAAEAIAARQEAALQAQIGRYKALSGTPTSLGTAEQRMLLGGIRDIRLPLEQAKIAREYDYLQGVSLPVQRELAGRETTRISQFNPMVAGQEFQAGTNIENTIQNLRLQTANMSFAQADQYLRSIGVPEMLRQQILSGQIAQLGGLAQLEEGSRYRGLQDLMGINVSQPAYYSIGTPGYGVTPRYSQPNVTVTGNYGTNPGQTIAPKVVTPNRYGQYTPDVIGNPANEYSTELPGVNYAEPVQYATTPRQTGAHSNSYYDTATGTLRDRTTGAITGYVSQPAEDYTQSAADRYYFGA